MSPKKTGELELEDRSENPEKCHREIKRWKMWHNNQVMQKKVKI